LHVADSEILTPKREKLRYFNPPGCQQSVGGTLIKCRDKPSWINLSIQQKEEIKTLLVTCQEQRSHVPIHRAGRVVDRLTITKHASDKTQ